MNDVTILESFILGKRKDQELNEDGLIITDDYIAVIDGASNSTDFKGLAGGLLAKNILINGILNLKNTLSGFETIKSLNALLNQAQKDYPEAKKNPAKRLMASILIYSIKDKQVWSYGDCKCMINKNEYQFNKKIDKLNAQVRSFVNQAEMRLGKSKEELLYSDAGAIYVSKLLNYQPLFANQNNEFGYPILDGFELNGDFFISIDVKSNDTIILATDGYPQLRSSLEESENILGEVLEKDPLLIESNRTVKGFYNNLNSYDDRTYIKFVVN